MALENLEEIEVQSCKAIAKGLMRYIARQSALLKAGKIKHLVGHK